MGRLKVFEYCISPNKIENIKKYRRPGLTFDGTQLYLTFNDGPTKELESYIHSFDVEVEEIERI